MNSIVYPAYAMKRLNPPTGFFTEENPRGSRNLGADVASVAGEIAPHSIFHKVLDLSFMHGYATNIRGKTPEKFDETELADKIRDEMKETVQNYKDEVEEACQRVQERYSYINMPSRVVIFDIPKNLRGVVEELLGVGNFQYVHMGEDGAYTYLKFFKRLISAGKINGLLKEETAFERLLTHEATEKKILDVLEKFSKDMWEINYDIGFPYTKQAAYGAFLVRPDRKNARYSSLIKDLAELGISPEDAEKALLPKHHQRDGKNYFLEIDFFPDSAHRLTERARDERGKPYASLAPIQPIIDAQKKEDIAAGVFAAKTEEIDEDFQQVVAGFVQTREGFEGSYSLADLSKAGFGENVLLEKIIEPYLFAPVDRREENIRFLVSLALRGGEKQKAVEHILKVASMKIASRPDECPIGFFSMVEKVAAQSGFSVELEEVPYSMVKIFNHWHNLVKVTLTRDTSSSVINVASVAGEFSGAGFAGQVRSAASTARNVDLGTGTFYGLMEKIRNFQLDVDGLTKAEKDIFPEVITQITAEIEPMVKDLLYQPDYIKNKVLLVDVATLLDKEGYLGVGIKDFFNNVSRDNSSVDEPVVYIVALEDSSIEETQEMWNSYGLEEGNNKFCKVIGPAEAERIAETYASKEQTSSHRRTFKALALVSKKFPNRIKWQAPLPENRKTLIGEAGENQMALIIPALRGSLDILTGEVFSARWDDRFKQTLINNGIEQAEAEETADYVIQGIKQDKGLQNISWVVPIPQPNYQQRQFIQQLAQKFGGGA